MKSDRGCVLAAVRKHHQPQHAANTLRLGLRPQPRSGMFYPSLRTISTIAGQGRPSADVRRLKPFVDPPSAIN